MKIYADLHLALSHLVNVVGQCTFNYVEVIDTNANGGSYKSDPKTKDDCQTVCTALSTCVAFDFNTVDNTCYTHVDGYLNDVTTSTGSGVNQYRKVATCSKFNNIFGKHIFFI